MQVQDYFCVTIPNSRNGIILVTKNNSFITDLSKNIKWRLVEHLGDYAIFANADSGIKERINDKELRIKIIKKIMKLSGSPAPQSHSDC